MSVVTIARQTRIIAEGDKPAYCFQVLKGCVRTVKQLEDGRRQIGQFLFPGDVFGWEAAGQHDFAVESVTPVTLQRARLTDIEEHAASDRGFGRRWHGYILSQVRAGHERFVLLGRKSAAERVSSFLIEMHVRINASAGIILDLPMSRVDISDYLGLTTETVSRVLASLRRQGIIAADGSRIIIRSRRSLCAAEAPWLN